MVRAWCRKPGRAFSTSYTTRFPEYIAVRCADPAGRWIYAALRRFHGAAAVTMVATPSLMSELRARGFTNLGMWTRGVDVDCSVPTARSTSVCAADLHEVGRVAIEKNLEAFLSLDLPGTKVVIGAGPHEASSSAVFREAKFLGPLDNGILAAHLAAADVFVFPSRTDTFGIVQLEALASGVPIAAFPVTGPKDVVGERPDRGSARGPRPRLHGRAEDFPRRLPQIRARLLVGKQRAAIPRPRPQGGERRQPRS